MKYLKIMGLAALAAMALTAVMGASTASATVLCKNSSSPCTEKYTAGTEIVSSLSGTATLTSTNTETTYVTCSGGEVKGKTSNTGGAGEAVSGPINSLTWSGCTFTTDTIKPGSLSIAYSSGSNGTVTSKEGEVTVNIFGSCIYGSGAGTNLGTLVGGASPSLTIHAVVKRQGFCLGPAETEWNATYSVTSPKPLYVAAS